MGGFELKAEVARLGFSQGHFSFSVETRLQGQGWKPGSVSGLLGLRASQVPVACIRWVDLLDHQAPGLF